MLTLINTNRMTPPIAPIGLDYVAGAAHAAGLDVEVVDLCLAEDAKETLASYFRRRQPELIGVSFRNVDDCFWPSARSFLPTLKQDIAIIRRESDAPIVLGGVGYSVFPRRLLDYTGADFGIHGDGEQALICLQRELLRSRQWSRVPGLVYRDKGRLVANAPHWPTTLAAPVEREFIDNETYFRRGGQLGVETKRGCARPCIYCIDPLAKGRVFRLRNPADVANEITGLAARGIDTLHLCDAEFNLPLRHAEQVCDELIRQRLERRVRWYAYLAVTPFPDSLAERMARAGCAGINFTSDAAHPAMLSVYRQPHRLEEIQAAVDRCRQHGIAVMLDMLLGGPGETPESVAETIEAFKRIDPDCAGAALGIRIYPRTALQAMLGNRVTLGDCPGIRRRYQGPIDLLLPTFFVSPHLGAEPAKIVRELIGDDRRFFPPQMESPDAEPHDDHNYNENKDLVEAIESGQRGAYWHILSQLRGPRT